MLATYSIKHVGFNSDEKWTYKMCKKVLISVKHSDTGVIWEQFPGKFIRINGQTINEGVGNRLAKERQQKFKLLPTITIRI
jgi:hypothetical protein